MTIATRPELNEMARALNLELVIVTARDREDVARAIDALPAAHADAVNVVASVILFDARRLIIERLNQMRVPAPDAKWGEAVTAVIVPRVGAKPAPAELIDLVKRLKGPAHAPKRVEFVDALPMTSVGKIDKKALKAKFWAGQQRMVG